MCSNFILNDSFYCLQSLTDCLSEFIFRGDRFTLNRNVQSFRSTSIEPHSNLPSPPSNDFLVQLEKYKFKTDKQSEVFRNNNLENTNQKANTLENISSDTGFSSRGDNSNNHNNNNTNNKRGRRLPLLPYERSSHHGKLNDLDQFTTSTPTAQAKEVVTTTAATSTPLPEPTEATKINRPKMIQLLSPTPSPRLLKGIRNYHHHQYQKRLSTNHCQLEDTPEHDQTTECDLV
ncbi:unnamed protein product [Trichobilharzia regenti]|nr:unnamed protein product [Trichobilharzia regenti]